MIAQRLTAIRRADCPAPLQARHHLTDEFAQAVRGQARHQDEPVAGVRLDTAVGLIGDAQRCGRTRPLVMPVSSVPSVAIDRKDDADDPVEVLLESTERLWRVLERHPNIALLIARACISRGDDTTGYYQAHIDSTATCADYLVRAIEAKRNCDRRNATSVDRPRR